MSCTSGDHRGGKGEGTWKGCGTSHFSQALTQKVGVGRKRMRDLGPSELLRDSLKDWRLLTPGFWCPGQAPEGQAWRSYSSPAAKNELIPFISFSYSFPKAPWASHRIRKVGIFSEIIETKFGLSTPSPLTPSQRATSTCP